MSEQSRIDIEKLLRDAELPLPSPYDCAYFHEYLAKYKEFAKSYAEAATTESNKRIAELQADNNRLREALEEIRKCGLQNSRNYKLAAKLMNSAYTKTPAHSLIEFENSVIEKCAKLFEGEGNIAGNAIALAIRALKGK